MATDRRRYTEEFKCEAVRLMETSGNPIAELARDLGNNDNNLYIHSRRRPERRVRTTDRRHNRPVAPNLLKRDFSAEAPNENETDHLS